MELTQFKKLYYELFVHSSSETIEEEKREEHQQPQQDIALIIKMGELLTRTITEHDLNHLSERHFHVMDTDGSGTLDVDEFIAGMGVLLNGTVAQQWQHSFNIFDVDGDGYITRQDLAHMFEATSNVQTKMLLELLKYTRDQLLLEGHDHVAKQFQIDIDVLEITTKKEDTCSGRDSDSVTGSCAGDPAVQTLVSDIFEEVDIDCDNRISFDEFCQSEILLSEIERLSAVKISFFTT